MTGLVEISNGGLLHSGRLVPVDQIPVPDNTLDWYRSVYLFGSEAKTYLDTHKNDKGRPTLGGFKGVVGLDFVPIDFDRNPKTHPNLPESAPLDDLRNFLMKLKGEGVNLDGLAVYFSGFKGYHCEIYAELFGSPGPESSVPAKARHVVEKITEGLQTVDIAIVGDHIRPWRLPSSINGKSGLRKTRLTLSEVFDLSTDGHKKIAGGVRNLEWTPREEFGKDEYLSGLFVAPREIKGTVKVKEAGGLFQVVEGSRHKGAVRAAAILINRNDPETVAQILRAAYPDLHAERPIDIPRIVGWLKGRTPERVEVGEGARVETVGDFMDQIFDFYKNGYSQGYDTGWNSLNALYLPAKGELTIVSGVPGHGKSEFMDALLVNMVRLHGFKFGVFSPENFPRPIHFEKLASKVIGKPFHEGGTNRMTVEDIGKAMAFIEPNFFWYNPGEKFNLDSILDLIRKSVSEKNLDGVLIDPWNEIDHQHEKQENENDYVTRSLTKVRRFLREHRVFGWVVAHPKKMERDKKTGVFNDVRPYDITGSSAWFNKADNILIVKRKDGNAVEIRTEKIKFKIRGMVGSVELSYDRITGIYSETRNTEDFRYGT